jgi:hypothetical protein
MTSITSTNFAQPRKLVDYTKQRGNHHLCAKNKVSTTTTRQFPSYEHHTCKGIPSNATISASSLDTTDTDTDNGCASENSDDTNVFLLQKVPPRMDRRQAMRDLQERCHDKRQSNSFNGVTPVLDDSTNSSDATRNDPASVEPIDFFLKVPTRRVQRQQRSDLRERFQSFRSHSLTKCSILRSILSESSTTRFASRKLPSSSSINASFRTI